MTTTNAISSIALPSATNGWQRGLSVIPKLAQALVQAHSTTRGAPLLSRAPTRSELPSTRRTACDVRSQKASHETRFVLGKLFCNLLKKNAFAMVGAPGLEPGTR
jgi:hypothetical protein